MSGVVRNNLVIVHLYLLGFICALWEKRFTGSGAIEVEPYQLMDRLLDVIHGTAAALLVLAVVLKGVALVACMSRCRLYDSWS